MSKGVELDFTLPINRDLESVCIRISKLHKYLRCDGFTGRYEIAFLPSAGGLDEQDWEWVEDIELVKNGFNSIKK